MGRKNLYFIAIVIGIVGSSLLAVQGPQNPPETVGAAAEYFTSHALTTYYQPGSIQMVKGVKPSGAYTDTYPGSGNYWKALKI